MDEVEHRYVQIEKEVLVATWACEKFIDYILGAKFTIETDHKPLVSLLSTTHLHNLPPRVLCFRFDYNICKNVPGKNLCTADTLSRASEAEPGSNSITFQNELEAYMHLISSSLPASSACLQEDCNKQKGDPVCSLIHSCATEWPDAVDVPSNTQRLTDS